MNKNLHELCKLAGFNQPTRVIIYQGCNRIDEIKPKYEVIGTHTGRRSFICNAISMGIPLQVVMKWTGHSDYKAMKPYIDVCDEIKAEAYSPRYSFGVTPYSRLKIRQKWGTSLNPLS